jgi:predicted alpha/beta-hydrolase family hydrolase
VAIQEPPVSVSHHELTGSDADAASLTTATCYDAGPGDAVLVLGHGAGAGQTHPFMAGVARALAGRGVDVVTFDFPYKHAGRKLPDRQPVLEACFHRVLEWTAIRAATRGRSRVFAGGKSMGGRIATHLGAGAGDRLHGVVALGYPLRPPGRAGADRTSHLAMLRVPLLVVQGTRDTFGTPDDIRAAMGALPAPLTVVAVEGGDHSFAVRGRKPVEVLDEAADAVTRWIEHI